MTLGETLLHEFASVPIAGEGQTVTAHDPATGWTATATVERAESLGASLQEVVCHSSGEPRPTRAWADSLAKRVRGLQEPLRLIEVDTGRDEAVLRSDVPTVRGDQRSHYELRLDGGRRATLKRYTAASDPTAKREPTPFALTHDVLGRLIDDLTAPLD